jgi:hypothetical protein
MTDTPRVNLRPAEGPPPARRATNRFITWAAVDVAFGLWGFVAFLVVVNLLVPWDLLDGRWGPLQIVLWIFAALFTVKAAFMTYFAGGLVRIWAHLRGRRRR